MNYERAQQVIKEVAAKEGYRLSRCDRLEITAHLRGSRQPRRIFCNPKSDWPISPVSALTLDAEFLREKLVDALVAAGLLA